jgi:hypothetical protein
MHNKLQLDQYRLDMKDACSSGMWIVRFRMSEALLAYNPLGGAAPNCLSLGSIDDFILFIQQAWQRHIVAQVCETVLCIDATHDTTHYGFQLFTLIVRDHCHAEFGRASMKLVKLIVSS